MTVAHNTVLRVTWQMAYSGGTVFQNIFHFRSDFSTGQADEDVVDAIVTKLENMFETIDAYLPNSLIFPPCSVDEVEWDAVEELWEVTRNVGEEVPAPTFIAAGEPLPNPDSAIVWAATERPKSRGRKFIGPLVETASNKSVIVAALLTLLGDFLDDYLDTVVVFGDNVLDPVIASTVTGLAHDLLSGVVNDIMGVQRKRKPGYGI